jgi:hypothetical protein
MVAAFFFFFFLKNEHVWVFVLLVYFLEIKGFGSVDARMTSSVSLEFCFQGYI